MLNKASYLHSQIGFVQCKKLLSYSKLKIKHRPKKIEKDHSQTNNQQQEISVRNAVQGSSQYYKNLISENPKVTYRIEAHSPGAHTFFGPNHFLTRKQLNLKTRKRATSPAC